jgi:hypothetical protein
MAVFFSVERCNERRRKKCTKILFDARATRERESDREAVALV